MKTGFGTVAMDPPWKESGGGKCKRGADRHYNLMRFSDIKRTIMSCTLFVPAQSCHLYIWATNNFMSEGLALFPFFGFHYINNIVWVKQTAAGMVHKGLGQYQRGSHELLLFGARGPTIIPSTKDRLSSVVFSERLKHSEKPAAFYERMQRVSPGPYLELFARKPRDGWVVWGNEV